jgi:hypothetical protein
VLNNKLRDPLYDHYNPLYNGTTSRKTRTRFPYKTDEDIPDITAEGIPDITYDAKEPKYPPPEEKPKLPRSLRRTK